jgi:hypothetical protein
VAENFQKRSTAWSLATRFAQNVQHVVKILWY